MDFLLIWSRFWTQKNYADALFLDFFASALQKYIQKVWSIVWSWFFVLDNFEYWSFQVKKFWLSFGPYFGPTWTSDFEFRTKIMRMCSILIWYCIANHSWYFGPKCGPKYIYWKIKRMKFHQRRWKDQYSKLSRKEN